VFKGQDAIDAGLADEIGSFEDVLAAGSFARSGRIQGAVMTEKSGAPAADAGISQEDHAQAVAAATQTAASAAAQAAQTRIKSILGAKEAKGRDELASHLAFNTQLSADDAVATLAAAPKAAAPASGGGASRLDALMLQEGQPKVDAAESGPLDHGAALGAALKRQLGKLGKEPRSIN
jgi:hypothetical protein